MADVLDEEIKKSLNKLHNDRDPTNWFSINYAEGSTDKFLLNGIGTGGINELSRSLGPNFFGYAYLSLSSQRGKSKYVLIQFVGEKCTALQKARVIVHEEDVLAVLKPVNAQISASSPQDLTEEKIMRALSSKQ